MVNEKQKQKQSQATMEMTQKWHWQPLLANATIVIKWVTELQTAQSRKTQTRATKTNVNAAAIVVKWDTSRQIVGIDQRTPTNIRNGTNLHVLMATNKAMQQLTICRILRLTTFNSSSFNVSIGWVLRFVL